MLFEEEVPCKVEENTWAKVFPILRFLELTGHKAIGIMYHIVNIPAQDDQLVKYHLYDEYDGYSIR